MAAQVKINFVIGGADAVSKAFLGIRQASERAIRQGVASERAAAKERVQTNRAAEREIMAAKRAAEKESERVRKAELAREREMAREVVAVVRQANREKLVEERKLERERQRIANQERNRNEHLARERQRALGGVIGGAAGGAMRGIGQAKNLAMRGMGVLTGVGGALMGGLGVEVGLGRAVQRRATMERMAIDLSNSAYQEQGVGVQKQRVDPKTLVEQANAVAQANAIDPTKALEGLRGFVGITGDLETGRAAMGDLAKLARATGTDLDQMVKAAGEMAKGMGDAATNTDEARSRAAAVYTVMKGLAGQGKLGSVEMKDMATHGARLAAAATQFEGNAGENALKMGMFAQEARGGGGAWNAATAAGAVSGIVTNFKTAATRKAFEKEGISLRGEGGKLRDPTEILKDAIDKTGGDIDKLTPLFKNVVGARAMQGFANKYLEASGGKQDAESKAKGRAAIDAEIKRMTKGATMSDAEVNDSFKTSMGGTEAKAQLFQQRIDKIAGDLADKLMPAMLKLAPVAENGAEVLGKFIDAIVPHADALAASLTQLIPVVTQLAPALAGVIGFAAKHPALAAAGIVGGNMAAGAIGSAASGALGQMAVGGVAARAIGGGGIRAALTGAAGLTGSTALGVGASGLVGYGVGTLATNKMEENLGDRRKILNEANALDFKIRGGSATPEEVKRGQDLVRQLKGDFGGVTGLVDKVTGGHQGEDAEKLAASLTESLAKAQIKLDPNTQVQLAPGVELNVRVTNPGDIGGSGGLQGPKAQTE